MRSDSARGELGATPSPTSLPQGWHLREAGPTRGVESVPTDPAVPRSVALVLARRGLTDAADVRRFLRPSLDQLHDPLLLPDSERAAARIERAIDEGSRIFVHGDFDADGMTSAALMVRGLRRLGASVVGFVPHRVRDGYDLSSSAVDRASRAGAGLIVTVDCGVAAHEAIEDAADRGLDVVVTDHHLPSDHLPGAVAVVNPNRQDSDYPFTGLAGVGVAFKLLTLLYRRAGIPEPELLQHLDLVAVGTIADQMPLVGENRVLVRAGLRALDRTRKPGLRELRRLAGADRGEPLTAETVAFRVAPRINAVGRMAGAQMGLDLLLGDTESAVLSLVTELEGLNEERREAERTVFAEAERFLADRPDGSARVAWGTGWHRGVLGLVASRIVDRSGRTTVVLGVDGDHAVGSGRSIPGLPLDEVLAGCADLLERFGGHRRAAGLTLRTENIEAFAARFESLVAQRCTAPAASPPLEIDLLLPLAEVTPDLFDELAYLEPHGPGNPRPVLASTSVRLVSARVVGEADRHLAGVLSDGRSELRAIGFGMGHRLEELGGETSIHTAFHLERDRYRGRVRHQAHLLAAQPAGS